MIGNNEFLWLYWILIEFLSTIGVAAGDNFQQFFPEKQPPEPSFPTNTAQTITTTTAISSTTTNRGHYNVPTCGNSTAFDYQKPSGTSPTGLVHLRLTFSYNNTGTLLPLCYYAFYGYATDVSSSPNVSFFHTSNGCRFFFKVTNPLGMERVASRAPHTTGVLGCHLVGKY